MESPPSFSGHSEAPPLSEDSGLLITSGSVSSDSVSGWLHITSELQESDYDEKSLSLYDCQETSERMCGDNFNTVKKGPTKVVISAIEPPPQFQDSPILGKHSQAEWECGSLKEGEGGRGRGPRSVSRLSCSHSSLATPAQSDDSSFITQAISHHTLSAASDIADMYNVPFDSDIYAIPIDMVRPRHQTKRSQRSYRKRGRSVCQPICNPIERHISKVSKGCARVSNVVNDTDNKRHSVPSTSMNKKCISAASIGHDQEPMHMTLHEVRKYLHTLYSSSSESETQVNSSATKAKTKLKTHSNDNNNSFKYKSLEGNLDSVSKLNENDPRDIRKSKKNNFIINIKNNKKSKEVVSPKLATEETKEEGGKRLKKSQAKSLSLNLKQTLCRLLGLGRGRERGGGGAVGAGGSRAVNPPPAATATRALPPLPSTHTHPEEPPIDFATSIQKVKDYGWYWGPISVEAAEKILSDEPDGSFIVRDSSDDHYIFTLTFKLNGMRHVRIEHDQGNFCFGSCTMFKAHTIVEFIENAVETSRSGRYLFFLNLRPVLGPMRVQLLYPVSRFKRVQSLQHMCRFVILKAVRRDLIGGLPLPRRLLDYLSTPHYYSEIQAES